MPKLRVEFEDGTIQELPDTPENRTKFGFQSTEQELIKGDVEKAISGMRFLGEAIPNFAGAAGGMLGGLPGLAGGTFAGSLIQRMLQSQFPQQFGVESEGIGGAVQGAGFDALVNTALEVPFRAISKLPLSGPVLRSELAKRFMGKSLAPEVGAGLRARPDLPITVGQGGQGTTANLLENLVTPIGKRKVRDIQQEMLSQEAKGLIGPSSSPQQIAEAVRGSLLGGLEDISTLANQQFGKLRLIAKQNVIKVAHPSGQVGRGTQSIEGPIAFTKTNKLAGKVIDKLNEDFGTESANTLLASVREEQRDAINALQRIVTLGGKPLSLDAALRIKAITGDKGFKSLFPGAEESTFRRLNALIDEDIQKSMSAWPRLGDIAPQIYREAKGSFEQSRVLFKETPTTSSLIEGPIGKIENIKTILKDPELIKRTKGAAKNPEQVKATLGSEFLADIIEKGVDPSTKQFRSSAPISEFLSRENDSIIRQLFTSNQRSAITNFFKVVERLDPKLPLAGVTALGIRAAGAGITLAPGLIDFAMTGSLKSSVQTSGLILGGLIGLNTFTKKVLLDPRVARIAANLAKLPPTSPQARAMSRTLFGALKGTQIMLMAPDGTILGPAEIGKTGKIEQVPAAEE